MYFTDSKTTILSNIYL